MIHIARSYNSSTMGFQCMLTLRRLFLIFLLVSILLIIAGVVFIVIGAMNYESQREEYKPGKARSVGAVIDAGGSGTRIYLYQYSSSTKRLSQRASRICEEKGIAKYADSGLNDVAGILSRCMRSVLRSYELPKNKRIPLYFAATGGMRLLRERNIAQYNALQETIQTALKNGPFNVSMAKTLTGEEEAKYGWLAVNSLPTQTTGMLDFGSTSLQISFEPAAGTTGPSGLETVKVNGKDVTIYTHSYLCYGRDEMQKRVFAKMIKDAGYRNYTENPCLFNGFTVYNKSEDLFSEPCVSGTYAQNKLGESIDPPAVPQGFRMNGTSNWKECMKVLDKLIDVKCTGANTSCGLNNIYQPPVNGKFSALAAFYYTAKFMGLPEKATVAQFKEKSAELCAKSWKQVEDQVAPTKEDPYKYAIGRCFDAVYSYFLLKKGFKFDDQSKDLNFVQNVQGKNVQWYLGLISTMKENLLPISAPGIRLTVIERSPNMLVLIVIGIIFIILGVVLLVYTIKARRNKDLTLVKTADEA